MQKWEKALLSMVGDRGLNTLKKAMHRRDSDSTIGPLDMYLPLLVVPRTILSWLVHNIKPIPVGEDKKLEFPGLEDTKIHITKVGIDSYNADFVKDGRVIHSFEKQTLPNVGGQLMTLSESYDDLNNSHEESETPLEEAIEEVSSPDITVPSAMVSMIAPTEPVTSNIPQDSIAILVGSIGKLVDALVSNHTVRETVEKAIKSVKDPTKPKDADLEDVGTAANKILDRKTPGSNTSAIARQKTKDFYDLESRALKDFTSKFKAVHLKAQMEEAPSGQAGPTKPDGINEPTLPSRKQKSLTVQKPKGYFHNKLDQSKLTVRKKEKNHHISETELYTPCVHCGVAEFTKSENGPKYKPCACFYITMKSEEGKETNFVKIIKKSEGGYSLTFNEKADPDTISTFLLTLRNKLKEYKDNLD